MSKKLNIRPLHDRVIIKRLAEEDKTAGGIIIPDSAKEKPTEGEVVAVGNGITTTDGKHRPLELKVGDKVLFEKWAATEVKMDGEEYLVMSEDKVIAVLGA